MPKKNLRKYFRPIVVLIVAVVLAAGLFTYYHYHRSGKVSSTTVQISSGAAKIQFDKTADFKEVTHQNYKTQRQFQISARQNGKTQVTGILAGALSSVTPQTLANLDKLNQSFLAEPGSFEFQAAVAPLSRAVQYVIPDYGSLSQSRPISFQNSHIFTNSWVFNVNAAQSQSGPTLQGQLIYSWTSKGAYTYILLIQKDLWQKDQATWQKMLDSITIQ